MGRYTQTNWLNKAVNSWHQRAHSIVKDTVVQRSTSAHSRTWRALSVTFMLLLSLWPTTAAWAQPPSGEAAAAPPSKEALAAARQLFKDALVLEAEKNWAEALTKLDKVRQIKNTPQVRYHIALCHENLGRWVEALNGFELAAQEARAAGDKARSVLEHAPKRASALRERVAYLKLTITGTMRSSQITFDGRPISMALIDTEIPVDPGTHRIRVQRDGKVYFERDIELAERQRETVVLEIDDPTAAPAIKPESPPRTPLPTPSTEPETGNPRMPAYITGGAGLAVLAAGGVFFGLRQATLTNLECDYIDTNPLSPTATGCKKGTSGTADLSHTYTTLSNVAFGVGGAALATGVVLFFVLGPDDESEPAPKSEPTGTVGVVASPTSLSLVGQF